MNITRALFLTCAMAAVSLSSMGQAAKTQATQPDNAPETKADILLLDKWRHVGFHLISDWQGGEVDSVLDDPTFGFALTYMKHDRHGLLDGGFDIGFQPMGGFDTTAFVVQDGKAPLDDSCGSGTNWCTPTTCCASRCFSGPKFSPSPRDSWAPAGRCWGPDSRRTARTTSPL
ncbi:MAG: hypothetical protein ACPHZB_00055 [Flavobacteriales bacterium]